MPFNDPRMPSRPPEIANVASARKKMGGEASPYEKNRSMLNPIDAASMASTGQGDLTKMSLSQFMQSQGLDLNGPAIQLVSWAEKQVQNSSNRKKLGNIAQDARGPQGPPAGMPSGPSMPDDLDQIAAQY